MNQTFFGKEKVSFEEKTDKVKALFNGVASHYDLMNDLMSFGGHRLWKKNMIQHLPLKKGDHILDVAGGTGDIALAIESHFRYLDPHITICDLSEEMIVKGRDKAFNHGLIQAIQWVCGNAEQLPFEDESFNGYTIAFGLRNVGNQEKAIKEAYRVLKPGGFFYCLELSHIQGNPLWDSLYQSYSQGLIPKLGEWVAGNKSSYAYLVDSVQTFPPQEKLKEMLSDCGLKKVRYKNYLGGIASLHCAFR